MIGSRIRSRRLGAILATAVFTLALIPGLATAANSRTLWIGSPDAQGNAGKLLPTTVSVPAAAPAPVNSTEVVVQIKSTDNQTIAHTILTIDSNKSNNAGLSLNTYFDPATGTKPAACTDDGKVITCSYGNLEARGQRTLAVIVDVAPGYTAGSQTQPLFWSKVTTNNENGSNQQLFIAASGPSSDDPDAPSPGFAVSGFNANNVFTFVPPGQAKQLFTSGVGGAGGDLSTNVSFKSAGEVVAITEGTSNATTYPCPSDLSCQGSYAEVSTTSGFFSTTPFFTWTVTAIVPKTYSLSQGFVAHYPTGSTTSNWRLLFKDRSATCGADVAAKIASAHQCISALSLTKLDKTTNLLVVTVVMDHQGGLKY